MCIRDSTTYDNILRLVKDPEVCDPIRFLRQRDIVHFQRFGEGLRMIQDDLDRSNFYMCNPCLLYTSLSLAPGENAYLLWYMSRHMEPEAWSDTEIGSGKSA